MKNDKPEEETLNRMSVIKEGLLKNRKGIYSIIVNHFESEIKEFGAQIFASSLADKLKIETEEINVFSLRSAMSRIKNIPKKSTKNDSSFTENILKGTPGKRDFTEDGFS